MCVFIVQDRGFVGAGGSVELLQVGRGVEASCLW